MTHDTFNASAVSHFRRAVIDFAVCHSVLITLAVFLVVGVAVLDDYGVSWDEPSQHNHGHATVSYILGENDALPGDPDDLIRFYGVAFEVLLVLVERLLGLEDSRHIYLSYHLLTHLFFLSGGAFCSLLVYRLFNSRLLALFALLLFLLHPRLYAHSFFNPKDLPFLSMFMIALYLIHRAFRRDTVWAFLLCGVGVGLLINIRIMGVMLFPAVLAMRACDFFYASGGDDRKHVLITGGVFGLASVLALYGSFPLLWSNPLQLVEVFSVFARHPNHGVQLFQGEFTAWPEIPPYYIPTWIVITTPPVALLLGLIGAAYGVYRGIIRPGDIFRNTTLRFMFLIMASLTLPLLAVVVLNSNVYDGWRHLYFCYAPLCLLGVFGLHSLVSARGGRFRAWVSILAAISMVIVVVEMILIHPYQMVYFNFLVDRSTPEYLRKQYDMDYWGVSHREGLEYLLERYPFSPIHISSSFGLAYNNNRLILPNADRRRIDVGNRGHDFYITNHRGHVVSAILEQEPWAPVIYTRKVQQNTILTVTATNLALVDEAIANMYQEFYRSTVAGEPVVRSDFDIYRNENTLIYIKEPCSVADIRRGFFLHVVPADADDLLDFRRLYGFDILNFDFGRYGVRFDGKCLIRRELPGYQIKRIVSGQWRIPWKGVMWSAVILPLNEEAIDMSRLYPSTVLGEPVVRSDFDIYLDGKTLIYVKMPCSPTDTRGWFFLHIYPTRPDDLPEVHKKTYGFENRHFNFYANGARSDGKCIAMSSLPEYPIARIRTGQDNGEGQGWVATVFPE